MSQNHFQIRHLIYIVTLSAISIVVGLIEIPWGMIIPNAGFLKLDFSEVIILVSLVLLGTKNTFFVILLRSIARRLVMGMGPDQWLGEGLAILASLSIILAYWIVLFIFKRTERPLLKHDDVDLSVSWKEWLIGTTLITISLTVVLFTVNFFLTTPLYFGILGDNTYTFAGIMAGESLWYPNLSDYISFTIISYIPFNLVKGILVSSIFFMVKPYLKAIKF